jgi:hypothetical protein
MRKRFLAAAIVVLSGAGHAVADERVPVTITGCVNRGRNGTFVLTQLEEISPDGLARPPHKIYWLSTKKGLNEHVGHKVEVAGTFSPSRDAGKTGKIKVETDPATGEEKLALENGIKKAEIVTDLKPVGTSGVKTEVTLPYRRLEVESLRMISDTCR